MSERFRLCFLALASDAAPPDTRAGARRIVARAEREPEESGLRVAISTGMWHASLAAGLTRAYGIDGLGFLDDEFRVLSQEEAAAAGDAIETLLERLERGELPETREPLGPQWDLIIKHTDLAEAVSNMVPTYEADEENGETESFVEFLVSLHIASVDAAEQDARLLLLRTEE